MAIWRPVGRKLDWAVTQCQGLAYAGQSVITAMIAPMRPSPLRLVVAYQDNQTEIANLHVVVRFLASHPSRSKR